MPRSRCVSFASLVLLGSATAQSAPSLLPLKRVRLYEIGVGYFERTGPVGDKAVTLPVPASHLDDALKTLVVFSGDGPTRIGGVEFGSSVSRGMARALAGLGGEGEALGLERLLTGLKGTNVELRTSAATVGGRVVEVLGAARSDLTDCQKQSTDPSAVCVSEAQPVLVLMTKAGELRRFRIRDLESVRPTDPGMVARLGAAVDALSEGSARLLKEVRVMARGGGSISLGYVSETPVWRASYRLVLADKPGDSAALQGWALVHNDTDEPWQRVQVELVNGSPDSFLFPLAAPRYARRELVTPENPLSTVPQLVGTTPDAMWDPDGEVSGEGGLGLSGIGEGGGGRGEGIGLGNIGTLGHGAGHEKDTASALLSVGNLAAVAESRGTESGALFRYALGEPLDLRPHGSALVPFLGEGIVARRIALFSSAGSAARSAAFLVHRGAQTLPPGTVAVFSDGGFAGESALPRLKPKQSTAVEFGTDLDVELEELSDAATDEPQRLTYSDDRLMEHFVRHHTVAHRIENRSGSGRDVFLRLDYVNNAAVRGADELAYDSEQGQPFAVWKVGAQTTTEHTLKVDEGLRRDHQHTTISSGLLRRLSAQRSLPEAQRKILLAAATELLRAETDLRNLGVRRATLAIKEAAVTRFREHARAVGKADGAEEVVERLLAAESEAEVVRVAVRALAASSTSHRSKAFGTLRTLGS